MNSVLWDLEKVVGIDYILLINQKVSASLTILLLKFKHISFFLQILMDSKFLNIIINKGKETMFSRISSYLNRIAIRNILSSCIFVDVAIRIFAFEVRMNNFLSWKALSVNCFYIKEDWYSFINNYLWFFSTYYHFYVVNVNFLYCFH